MSLTWLEKKFIYYTECQLATLETVQGKKRTPKCEIVRHENIAKGMLECCQGILGNSATAFEEVKLFSAPRVIKRLRDNGTENAGS